MSATEALVSSILQLLSTVTIEGAKHGLKLLKTAQEATKKAERNLRAIHALLEDAEEKKMQELSVKLWPQNVKEASYELEDILDGWNYHTVFQKSKSAEAQTFSTLKKKVLSFLLCDSFIRVCNIIVKINHVNEELDEIAKDVIREAKQSRRLENTSVVDESLLHGRNEMKKEIVSTLLYEDEQNSGENDKCRCRTISIVGMGGIGKTALAQLIYNDPEVEAYFSKIIWGCVTEFFDHYKVARAILERLDQPLTSLINLGSIDGILRKIKEKLKNEKFFLILDDVWSDRNDDWESFKEVFQNGKLGSRVLVTTRKDSVARVMGSFQVFDLKILSDNVCWLILKQMAFAEEKMDGTLEDVGKEIAKKCKGLPLAAKTLRGLLSSKRSRIEWENVLNSDLWKLNLAQENIFTHLLLSYYDLPLAIRQCLLYCVIFPKYHELSKCQLITHWMAQGYLNTDSNAEIELVGEEYFNCLASRSLLQDFVKGHYGNISRCKMHDIVHDFIKFLIGDEILVKVSSKMPELRSSKTRHLNVTIETDNTSHFLNEGMQRLRTCLIKMSGSKTENSGDEVLGNLLKRAEHLRLVVVRAKQDISISKIPKSIRKLIHLRCLDFRSSGLVKLSEAVCDLLNLLFLDVSYCNFLEELPDGIGKLINLRHLGTEGCDRLCHYPKGIAKLTCLRKLPFVKATTSNDGKQFSVGDLENLDHLQGRLTFELKGNVLNGEEFNRAKRHNKLHLLHLFIQTTPTYLTLALQELLKPLNPLPHPQLHFSQK